MISKVVALYLSISYVSGAAYSNVYVQSGADVVPLEFVNYGLPPVTSQLGRISAASAGCVPPCALPAQPGAKANIITYQAPVPNIPAVLENKEEPKSYEYSYVVYDENTGDQKAQRELSDGSFVSGHYSLIQPDGYVREVQYTADDLKGFNAVVKNFLPPGGAEKKSEHREGEKEAPPCIEVKNEAFIEAAHGENFNEGSTEVGEHKGTTETKHEPETEHKKEGAPEEHPNAHSGGTNEINAYISYNDILRCIQAAIARGQSPQAYPAISPLTYVILPGAAKKLCA